MADENKLSGADVDAAKTEVERVTDNTTEEAYHGQDEL